MMTLLGASLSLAGLAGCRRPVEEIVPYVTAPEDIVPGIPRYYATTMPFRRSAYGLIVESHEGRPTKIEGNPSHPSTLGASSSRVQASVLGLYDPDRSQTVRLKGEREVLGRFRGRLGGAGQGACRGRRRRPGGPLRVVRLTHPGAPGRGAPRPLPEVAVGDLRRRQRREPPRRPAVRHRARPRPHAPARSSVGHPRPRRRPAPDRPRDDPSHARLRGRPARGSLRRRDEPALRRRRGLLADRRDGGPSAPPREPADRALPRRARRAPCASQRRSREPGGQPASRGSTRAGSTPWPRTCWPTAARG